MAGEAPGCFVEKQVSTRVYLDPAHLGDVAGGVREVLNRCLMRYTSDLGGVPTHVISARLTQRSGAIVADAPGVHCGVDTSYMVFSPKQGHLLVGEVNAVSGDHIGMLIFNNWNASIPRSHIPEQYEYDHESEQWCDRDFDSPVIEAGSAVSFAFRAFEMGAGGAFSIIGSLDNPRTGLVPKDSSKRKAAEMVSDASDAEAVAPSKKGKKRKKGAESGSAVAPATPGGAAAMETDERANGAEVKKKKKKSKKVKGEVKIEPEAKAAAVASSAQSADGAVKKKKKKKKKMESAE